MIDVPKPDVVLIEDALWVVASPTGMPVYDFAFEAFFPCRHPFQREGTVTAVARMGAASDYAERYRQLLADGIQLVHTPAEYERTSFLPLWYPLITDLTPRSVWFDRVPEVGEVTSRFAWPVFVKGARQTSKHQARLSIITGPEHFRAAMDEWQADPILWWQQIVCREYVKLRPVAEGGQHAIPPAFEFRTFWWNGHCVGCGPYWTGYSYSMDAEEQAAALAVAGEAARRIGVTFLVVDMAQTVDGRWIVIECNDGQDSGYAGVAPFLMWRRVVDICEQGAPASTRAELRSSPE